MGGDVVGRDSVQMAVYMALTVGFVVALAAGWLGLRSVSIMETLCAANPAMVVTGCALVGRRAAFVFQTGIAKPASPQSTGRCHTTAWPLPC